MALVNGTPAGEEIWGKAGEDTKLDAKQGDDHLIGSNGNDLLIGGQGDDVLFGGLGKDTFEFGKNANDGDVDYIDDFKFETGGGGDLLKFQNGVKIVGYEATLDGPQNVRGIDLHNDAKAFDVMLTLQWEDKGQIFTQSVYLIDALKNTSWQEDQFLQYLENTGALDLQAA
ncbi:hypothetical protein [Terrihabitans rhizophilus]|uniref:Haemolysin-type calcium binding-related domain-containing protein n=1 Tax=Terrihabitans rhizophilus TaxID=3092662 RepID=A0ABU4RJJ0_9HYPH|nr:hypothetical protein [Terrihabitans sp. PJ23]MDX6805007.1 hypothetical protein [Terrihabitans sp. PJ23]